MSKVGRDGKSFRSDRVTRHSPVLVSVRSLVDACRPPPNIHHRRRRVEPSGLCPSHQPPPPQFLPGPIHLVSGLPATVHRRDCHRHGPLGLVVVVVVIVNELRQTWNRPTHLLDPIRRLLSALSTSSCIPEWVVDGICQSAGKPSSVAIIASCVVSLSKALK